MSIFGRGGMPPRGPGASSPGQPPNVVIGPGSNKNIIRARIVTIGGGGPVNPLTSGEFVYSTSPGRLGTLVASSSAQAGFDQYGNAVLVGDASYFNVAPNIWVAVSIGSGRLNLWKATGPAGPWNFMAYVSYQSGLAVNNGLHIADQVANAVYVDSNLIVSAGFAAAAADPAAGNAETWHAVPYLSGWASDVGEPLQYRLNADGMVDIQGAFKFTSTAAGQSIVANNQFAAAIDSHYFPASQQRAGLWLWDGTLPNLARNANRSEHLLINTDGTLFVEWTSGGASAAAGQTARYFAQGSYRLT